MNAAVRPAPAGTLLPVTVVVLAILVFWYAMAVVLNAPWARDQAERAGVALGPAALVAATMAQERPRLPAPHQVVAELWKTVVATPVTSKRSLVYHAWVTLAATLAGFGLGAGLGIVLAVGIVHDRTMDASVMPWVIASQTIPILAIAPMIIVVLNSVGVTGLLPKALISMYLSFFPVVVGMVKGLRSPDRMLLDQMRTWNASRRQVLVQAALAGGGAVALCLAEGRGGGEPRRGDRRRAADRGGGGARGADAVGELLRADGADLGGAADGGGAGGGAGRGDRGGGAGDGPGDGRAGDGRAGMSLLEVENLRMVIRERRILRGVSLAAEAGEVLGVVGESGSGKSMTALSVMRLAPERAWMDGRVLFAGRDLRTLSEREMCAVRGRDIGMIFQEPMTALNPLRTIGDQVAETVRIHGRSAARVIAAQTLERVGLPQRDFPLDRYPHELSGGQRQRVGIAMAIALQPKLLIADEPTTALDVTTQAQILALLRRLVDEDGMALMLITHDLAVVSGMADRIAIMNAGEVVEAGPTGAVLDDMQHPYTRALFAASAHVPERAPRPARARALLEVEGLVREYPAGRLRLFGERESFRAVKGVSFTLREGESLGLVGESGSGKSTLARARARARAAAGGHGADRRRDRRGGRTDAGDAARQDAGGVPGPLRELQPAAPGGAAGGGAVPPRAGCAGRGPAADGGQCGAEGRRAADPGRRPLHPRVLGGQRQRIAIARALIIRPKLIVLDEAVSALDVQVRAQVLDMLARLSDRYGLSYLFVSHDLTVVRAVTDRVMVMKAGEIVEIGPTERVFMNPTHPYTRELLAAAPVLEGAA